MVQISKLIAFIVSRDGCDVTKEIDILRLIYGDLNRHQTLPSINLCIKYPNSEEYKFSLARRIYTNMGKIHIKTWTGKLRTDTIIEIDLQDIQTISCIDTNHLCLSIRNISSYAQLYIVCTGYIPESNLRWFKLIVDCMFTAESMYYPRLITCNNEMGIYDEIVKNKYGSDTNVERILFANM